MTFLLLALLLGPPGAAPLPSASPIRLTHTAFGKPSEIEVRDLAPEVAREVIHRAFAEIADAERFTDPSRAEGGLGALNAAAGQGPQPVEAGLLAALARTRDFCVWSENAHGPLGRDLYALWGFRAPPLPIPEPPSPERAAQAAGIAACSRLTVDVPKGTATLAEGSGLDFWGFAEGYAVDRAVEILRRHGSGNAFVRIGMVQRGFGAGPAGKGWLAVLPQVPGMEEPASRVYLLDKALASASQEDHPQAGAGKPFPYVNQRTGQPAEGVVAAAAVADQAIDAQGLATILVITGPREGQLRLGSLRPKPSVRWFLGSGEGTPLQVDYRWSEVSRR